MNYFAKKLLNMTMNVGFENLSIRSKTGLYPEEKLLGNHFDVTLKVAFPITEKIITDMNETIDYAHLVTITREIFSTDEDLLETVAQKIIQKISNVWPNINGIDLSIRKLKPLTLPMVGSTVVELRTGCFETRTSLTEVSMQETNSQSIAITQSKIAN